MNQNQKQYQDKLHDARRCLTMAREYAPGWWDTQTLEELVASIENGWLPTIGQINTLEQARRVLVRLRRIAREGVVTSRVADVFDEYDPDHFSGSDPFYLEAV